MKSCNKKLTIVVLLIQILFTILNVESQAVNIESEEEIYDVILFWGQSNMTGYCGSKSKNGEKEKEKRYDYKDEESVQKFSKITGISTEILRIGTEVNHINVDLNPNVAYDYKYSSNELVEITSNTYSLGEMLKYNSETKELERCERQKYFSLEESYGTNLIPQFCKKYYEKTGHKVVAVMASNGGEEIAHFLPNNEVKGNSLSKNDERAKQYIYEAMVKKYNSAIQYLESKGYNIENKIYVAFQGENDAKYIESGAETIDEYINKFQKVHNNLENDCGITLGAIIETAYTIGMKYNGVQGIYNAQEQIIKNNENIILGSNYPYKHYVPSQEIYEQEDYINSNYINENGEKLNYGIAYLYASYSMCLNFPEDNLIHFTSATLSQIGDDVAESISNYLYDENSEMIEINEEIDTNLTSKIQSKSEIERLITMQLIVITIVTIINNIRRKKYKVKKGKHRKRSR